MVTIVVVIISTVLFIIAGLSKSLQDTLQFHYNSSRFSNPEKYNQLFWNPKVSWMNKWKYEDGTLNLSKERFKGSSTIFVFTTDAWHLTQFFNYSFLIIALVLSSWFHLPVCMVAGIVLYRGVFELSFRTNWS